MAKEDLEVHSRITELNLYIEAVDRKVEELIVLKDSLKNCDEAKDLADGIQELKKQQEDVKRKLNEVMREFSLSIENFRKKEDDMMERLSELMLKFGKEGCCSFMFGDLKIKEDYMSQMGSQLSEESDDGWEALKAIKDRTAELEGQLSSLLFDFMVELSKNDEELLAKFQKFKSSLVVLAEGDKTSAVKRVIDALESADKKVKTMKTLMLLEFLEGSSGSIEETSRLDGELKESQLDQLFDKVRNEILLLELILNYPGLPESKILTKRVLSFMKASLRQCEQDMEDIEKEVNKMKKEIFILV